jgi:hypothetical protein
LSGVPAASALRCSQLPSDCKAAAVDGYIWVGSVCCRYHQKFCQKGHISGILLVHINSLGHGSFCPPNMLECDPPRVLGDCYQGVMFPEIWHGGTVASWPSLVRGPCQLLPDLHCGCCPELQLACQHQQLAALIPPPPSPLPAEFNKGLKARKLLLEVARKAITAQMGTPRSAVSSHDGDGQHLAPHACQCTCARLAWWTCWQCMAVDGRSVDATFAHHNVQA